MNRYKLHEYQTGNRTSTEHNALGMDNERTTTGELLVGCPFTILNMHKIPQWIYQTSMDINELVMDIMDLDGWVPYDNGLPYMVSSTHLFPQSVIAKL